MRDGTVVLGVQYHEKNGIKWLTFDHIEVKHAIFFREGGVSSGPYSSLNFGFQDGKKEENTKRAQEVLGFKNPLFAKQVHGKIVEEVSAKTESGIVCDGMMTNEKNLALFMRHADCQAALFYDPINQAVANVHCGWRGSVQNIYKETIQKMKKAYGTFPENLLVGISPSLGPNSAEFINYERELPPEFFLFQVKPTYFDFWEISKHQLKECGVLPHHIEIAEIDTFTDERCFSFRRSNRVTGHHGTFIETF